jgi:hypothetical protein
MSYLQEVDLGGTFPPFVSFEEYFGMVPKLFRAQTLLPRRDDEDPRRRHAD